MTEHQPLGHRLIEGGWAGALLLDGAARESADNLYQNLLEGCRIMAKPWEYKHRPQRYASHTMARVRRARDLGVKIQLSIDIHNSADNQGGYHDKREIPNNLKGVVKAIIQEIDPDELEVINEPYYCKSAGPGNLPKKLRMEDYLHFFNVYADAARQANWHGLICAWQDNTDLPGNFRAGSWIWHGEWDDCAEVRHDFVLDQRSEDPDIFEQQIKDAMDNPRRFAVGWRWPIYQNEHSSLGRQVHINSSLGARMCQASWNAYSAERCPWGFLTVGGSPGFGGGSWGMHTDLIDDRGEYSLGCKALMSKAGVEVPENGNPPPDPTETYPGTVYAGRAMKRAHELDYDTGAMKRDAKFQNNFRKWHKKWS